jgi:small conductance mechanosensitive channel
METRAAVIDLFRNLHQIRFVRIMLIIAMAWLLVKMVRSLLPRFSERLPARLRLPILSSIPLLRILIWITAAFMIVPLVIKPNFRNLVAILGAAGLALGFALKDYASSVIAGLVVMYERPYKVGDWVQIEGAYGEVTWSGLRSFRLLTPDATVVTVPHKKMWDSNVFNSNFGSRDMLCVAEFFLVADHDAALVQEALRDVALTSAYLNLNRPVTVTLSEKPWATQYCLKAYPIDARDQFQFISDLTIRGKVALKELGAKQGSAFSGLGWGSSS